LDRGQSTAPIDHADPDVAEEMGLESNALYQLSICFYFI